jgi:hypothetical protein
VSFIFIDFPPEHDENCEAFASAVYFLVEAVKTSSFLLTVLPPHDKVEFGSK